MNQPNEPEAPHAAQANDPASTISADIDHALDSRWAPRDTWRGSVEETVKHDCGVAWRAMKKRPSLGVLVFGGLAIAAADAVGVGQLAMGLAVGYGAYRVLRKGKSVDEHIEHG
jgi:hypothetical protein